MENETLACRAVPIAISVLALALLAACAPMSLHRGVRAPVCRIEVDARLSQSVFVPNPLSTKSGAAIGELRVSPLPGVEYEDGDLRLTQWTVDVTTDAVQDGPQVTVSRSAGGGNPDAFRSITYLILQGSRSATVFHGSLAATYDPTQNGAILVIDFQEDGARSGLSLGTASTWPFFEQAGRRFAPSYRCSCSSGWDTCSAPSRRVDEFAQVGGLACQPGES